MSLPCPVPSCRREMPGSATLCGACEADLRRALDDVGWLAAELDVTLSRQTPRTSGGGTGEIEDDSTPAVLHIGPLGMDPRASEAAWVLRNALVGWVRVIGEGWTAPHGPACRSCAHPSCVLATGPRDTPASMAAWLSAMLPRLVRHPAAEEAHGEIVAAVQSAMRVVDRPGEPPVFAGRCQGCGTALYARLGASVVQCRDCDAEPVDVGTQLDAMRDQVRDQLMRPAAAERLLARLGIRAPESTIRRWAARHRILAHGTDGKGDPVYRIGDILDVITQDAPQIAG